MGMVSYGVPGTVRYFGNAVIKLSTSDVKHCDISYQKYCDI